MRRPFTTQGALGSGFTRASLRWAVERGQVQRVGRGVFVTGTETPTDLERAVGVLVATGGVAGGSLAAVLYGLDSVRLGAPSVCLAPGASSIRSGTRNADLTADQITNTQGFPCATGLQTMLQLASTLDDAEWEQALESALRKQLFTIPEMEGALATRRRGNSRIRRVLDVRPLGAPPTESLLETLAEQLMRRDAALPTPTRQLEIRNRWGMFEARVDMAFPAVGAFFELDGQHHKNQPLYDANRQTRVVAATGWLVGRFTWDEIVVHPKPTLRRMADFFETARAKHG